MRKIWSALAVFLLLFALTACSMPKQSTPETMVLKPSEFSEETKQVLDLFDEDMIFFDFVVDETVKSSQIDVWVFENNEWVNKGATSGNINDHDNKIAIQLTKSGYNIFTIDESGHTKYSAPEMDIGLENTDKQITSRVTNPTKIIVGKEIPLWVKVGNDEGVLSSSTDFRMSNCTAGIAFTVTFSDEEIQ